MTETQSPIRSTSRRSRKLPLALLILTAGLIAALLGMFFNTAPAQELDLLGEDISLAYGPENYDAALTDIDRQMALAKERVARDPSQWAYQENLAVTSLIRAQLTGNFQDYLQASTAIETAMQLAPDGGGPAMTDAVINLSLHRYPAAQKDLGIIAGFAVPPSNGEQAEILASKGDVSFYGGKYAEAFALYKKAGTLDKGPRTLFRLATWHKYNGEFDQAIALYERGASNRNARTPQMLSVYLLQIGALELQRGNWELAHRYFVRADKVFPGYWLAEAHVAQMLAVEGHWKQAEKAYLAIIEKTGSPDAMMALASLYEHWGDTKLAEIWSQRAGTLVYEHVIKLPEAYYDHALDFAITDGDKISALNFARKNHEARPYGDAIIALARAHMVNGDADIAVELLQKVSRSGWQSTEQYLALAEAYRHLGAIDLSEQAMDSAVKLNPKANEPKAQLLAFGNH